MAVASEKKFFWVRVPKFGEVILAVLGFALALGFTSWYLYRLLKDVVESALRSILVSRVKRL
jgi:hypothetical protein